MVSDTSFAIYVNTKPLELGHIKFGGYDEDAILPGKSLTKLGMDLTTMSVYWNYFKLGGKVV
jgi:hypothetical protein